jgi:predicted CopG family antitoxin
MTEKEPSRTTILIDKELWKRFRVKCLEEGKSASSVLEELIKKKLGEK